MAKMGGAVLELLETLKGQTIWQDFYDKHGEGMHHIGLFVKNFPAALSAFVDRGFKITVDGPILAKIGPAGSRISRPRIEWDDVRAPGFP